MKKSKKPPMRYHKSAALNKRSGRKRGQKSQGNGRWKAYAANKAVKKSSHWKPGQHSRKAIARANKTKLEGKKKGAKN